MNKKNTKCLEKENNKKQINEQQVIQEEEKNRNSEKLKSLTGINYKELANDLIYNSAYTIHGKYGNTEDFRLVAQALADMEPKNIYEGMLCAQIAILHMKGMQYLTRAEQATLRSHQDPDLNNAIKLLRLHHETIECLMKLRRGNEQKVTVQHQYVQVNGGQTVVAQMGEGVNNKIREDTPC